MILAHDAGRIAAIIAINVVGVGDLAHRSWKPRIVGCYQPRRPPLPAGALAWTANGRAEVRPLVVGIVCSCAVAVPYDTNDFPWCRELTRKRPRDPVVLNPL